MSEHAFLCRYIDMTIYSTHHVLKGRNGSVLYKNHDTLFTANDSLMFFISFSACQGHMPKKSYQNGISVYIYMSKSVWNSTNGYEMFLCVHMCSNKDWVPKNI